MGLKEISLRFKLSWIKISNFEFWPIWAVYFPVFFYWIYHALVTRNFTYFTLVNPGIEYGGVFGESKINILKKIPEEFLPKSLYFEAGETIEPIKAAIEKAGVTYPFVCKPDKGEMGHLVCKINNELELNDYVSHYNGKLIGAVQRTFGRLLVGLVNSNYPFNGLHCCGGNLPLYVSGQTR